MRRLLLLSTLAIGAALAPGASAATSPTAFQSPSRNIGCIVSAGSARCDIRARDWAPPAKPASCPVDYGQGRVVGATSTRGRFVCAGDTALGGPGVLPYGRSVRRGSITCTSRTTGVTCKNKRGHGFLISRGSYRRF